jgi:hypothetical protein
MQAKAKSSRMNKTRTETYDLTIGKQEDVDRLIGSTVWLSNESAHAIWQVGSNLDNSKCVINEGMRHWLKSNGAMATGNYCEAIVQANMYALLTNRFLISTTCCRAANGIAMKLRRVIDAIGMVILIILFNHYFY